MIVSHEHGFIFVKTRKTAGTSIEVFLSRIAGPDAIVTPVGPPVPGHEPRNYDVGYNHLREWVRTRGKADRIPARLRSVAFLNHMPAELIRERVGTRKWNSYFKFCFERDPWDKVVSHYHYRAENGSEAGFREYVLEGSMPTDFDRYSLGGRIAVDFVGQYRSLESDLAHALAQIGIDTPVALTREKTGLRPATATVEDLFTPELDQKVATVFRREIAAFQYEDRSRRS
jgi:hypothetical protein